jgi:lipopolysaccharide cholinephosphotransferase
MKRVWQVQMTLLKKLLDVCQKHHLRVWGDGGTMLGTVREHGYIPWDDDIDMVLLRPDYDKLVQLAQSEFKPPFFFQCGYTDHFYPNGHARLRMDGTAAIPLNLASPYSKKHLGVFIDVFPYDAVPDNKDDELSQIRQRDVLFKLLRLVEKGWDPIHPFSSIKYVLKRSRYKSLYAQYENLFRKYSIDDNRFISCYSFQVNPRHFLREKEWYSETVYLPFEDVMMPLPKEYDKILRLQYGDYMTPVKAPSYHDGFLVLTTEKSYQECLKERRRELLKKQMHRYSNRIKQVFKRF